MQSKCIFTKYSINLNLPGGSLLYDKDLSIYNFTGLPLDADR